MSAPLEALATARAYLHVRQWQAAADTLAPAATGGELPPEGWRIYGLALGHLHEPAAPEALRQAVAGDPQDMLSRGALASLLIQRGEGAAAREALGLKPLGIATTLGAALEPGELEELAGAARWLEGRSLLLEPAAGDARPAVRVSPAAYFREAAQRFHRATPADLLAERATACYVGAAIAHLLDGHWSAAQQLYVQWRKLGLPDTSALATFAATLYELAQGLQELDPAERAAACEPLRDLLAGARLRLRYWDGSRPVAMHWDGLPVG